MSLDASTAQVLSALVKSVSAGLAGNWVATPVPERLAILAREEIIRFVRETFPAAAIEKEDAPTLRRVAVRVYTPRDCHRVETWGVPCEAPPKGTAPDALSGYSWILLAHQCADEGDCPRLAQWEACLRAHELKRLEHCVRERLALSLWMGTHAPGGCPSCQPVPQDR